MKRSIKITKNHNHEVTALDIRIINELIDQVDEATKKIFRSNASELLDEPIRNVVTAVWDVKSEKRQPTSTQRQIDQIIRPMIAKIQDALEIEELIGVKDCVIEYLIKRLAISEILFMTQCYKHSVLSFEQSKSLDIHNLADIKVAGHA
ncbi:MAG: hypothetical protein ABSH41_11430 [Syntrophobacteraceae bacterium]|jgi:hypothetical protein